METAQLRLGRAYSSGHSEFIKVGDRVTLSPIDREVGIRPKSHHLRSPLPWIHWLRDVARFEFKECRVWRARRSSCKSFWEIVAVKMGITADYSGSVHRSSETSSHTSERAWSPEELSVVKDFV